MKTLVELAVGLDTDKGTVHSYLPVYDKLFQPLRHQPVRLLEIGVKSGGSIELWLKFFSQAHICGLDLQPPNMCHDRLTLIKGNQIDEELLHHHFKPESLDIIIDDGSHIREHQALSHHFLLPTLKDGGLYIVEDIQAITTYWDGQPNTQVLKFHKNKRHDDILVVMLKTHRG